MSVTYHGSRGGPRMEMRGSVKVWVEQEGQQSRLPTRNDLRNHSPDGFEWGYTGSGPAQLAVAILAHAIGDDELAVRLYQQYKFQVIARLREESWSLDQQAVLDWVQEHR